jgi:hypothetical protein
LLVSQPQKIFLRIGTPHDQYVLILLENLHHSLECYPVGQTGDVTRKTRPNSVVPLRGKKATSGEYAAQLQEDAKNFAAKLRTEAPLRITTGVYSKPRILSRTTMRIMITNSPMIPAGISL